MMMEWRLLDDDVKATFATVQGPRDQQEDFCAGGYVNDGFLVGVFDGHGGKDTARRCADILIPAWNSLATIVTDDVMHRLRLIVRCMDVATENFDSGSTVSIAFIDRNKTVYTAILGDSPIFALCGDKWEAGVTHNIRVSPGAKQEAISKGAIYFDGYVWTGSKGLQVSRALGDFHLRTILTREQVLQRFDGVTRLVVASDGLDGVLYPSMKSAETAKDLIKAVPNLHDNVSAFLIDT